MARRVEEVVKQETKVSARDQELSLPLYKRAVKPALSSLASHLSRFVPAAREASLAQKMIEAGNPGNLTPRELLVIKYLLAAGCTGGLWSWAGLLNMHTAQCILMAAAGAPLGWLGPDFFLKYRAQNRKDDVEKNLPDVLDLLTVSVEAGLGFDGALMKVVEKARGVIADEFIIMLQEIKMGKPRQEALRNMADRIAVDDMSNFVGSIVLADKLGISIGNILRMQSEQMRQKRRQRAEEKGMKAPVKMLIPMVLFIFPAIFIILLGPAVMKIMKAFTM
ncbi:MAG: type II secretion system F family protein [Clostridiales bacterium]|nr:type II secretion system F family protein [Clostridiales bacterium]MCF8023056.1 type II secretion system F family protein [Clostridiales bacterium]